MNGVKFARSALGAFALAAASLLVVACPAPTAVLSSLSGSPYAAGAGPWGVAQDPKGRFLFVTNNAGATVSGYAASSSDGSLTALSGSPFAVGSGPMGIAEDPTGSFLYVANNGSGNVSAYAIGSDGALTAVAGSPYAAGAAPVSLTVDPSGKFLYVASHAVASGGNIFAFTIAAGTGALTAIAGSPFTAGTGPQCVATDPAGKYLYVANYGNTNGTSSVSGYTIDSSTGVLTAMTNSPSSNNLWVVGATPQDLTFDPTGAYLYVTNVNANYISAYAVDSTGALTALSSSPFATGKGPWGATLDSTGKFLLVANSASNTVSVYSITASTGALVPVTGSPFTAGAGPLGIGAMVGFVYVANQNDNTLSAYKLNASSGSLMELGVSLGVDPR